MKRISAILMIIISAFWLSACNATPINSTVKGKKPWDIGSNRIYERSDYSVTRYDKNNDIVGEGVMYFILESETDVESESELTDRLLRLRMHLELNLDNIGKDSIDSEVIFTESAMTPVWMHKKAVIVPRLNMFDESYELEICYKPEYYRENFRERYDSPKGYFARSSFDNGEISSLPINSGNYYDNEELFFLIRAMQDLSLGASLSAYIANGFDIFDGGKFFTYVINILCSSNAVNLKMNDVITSKFSEDNLVTSEEEKLIPCLYTNAYINGKDRGTPIVIYYALNPFSYPHKTDYALMKIETSEYSAESRALVGKTVYELTNYSVR